MTGAAGPGQRGEGPGEPVSAGHFSFCGALSIDRILREEICDCGFEPRPYGALPGVRGTYNHCSKLTGPPIEPRRTQAVSQFPCALLVAGGCVLVWCCWSSSALSSYGKHCRGIWLNESRCTSTDRKGLFFLPPKRKREQQCVDVSTSVFFCFVFVCGSCLDSSSARDANPDPGQNEFFCWKGTELSSALTYSDSAKEDRCMGRVREGGENFVLLGIIHGVP